MLLLTSGQNHYELTFLLFLVVIGYVEREEYRRRRKKAETTKKKKEEENEEEKEIWSGTDGMYDATRYIKKRKTTMKK